jgi:hypothetical protein
MRSLSVSFSPAAEIKSIFQEDHDGLASAPPSKAGSRKASLMLMRGFMVLNPH